MPKENKINFNRAEPQKQESILILMKKLVFPRSLVVF
jgi:hypothetical protein